MTKGVLNDNDSIAHLKLYWAIFITAHHTWMGIIGNYDSYTYFQIFYGQDRTRKPNNTDFVDITFVNNKYSSVISPSVLDIQALISSEF